MNQKDEKKWMVPSVANGQTIDRALMQMFPGDSRRKLRRLLDAGSVQLNGKRVKIASFKVFTRDIITVFLSKDGIDTAKKSKEKPLIPLLYQDPRGLFAVNKPPLILSQKAKADRYHVLEDLLLEQCSGLFPKKIVYLCHRLDLETSGVILVASQASVCDEVTTLFKERLIKKTYLALVWGIPPQKHWEVRCNLSLIDKQTGDVKVIRAGGRPSLTEFTLLKAFPEKGVSLVECRPHTGRSHQLRVHLAQVCHLPIVGDKRYDPDYGSSKRDQAVNKLAKDHHFLHAKSLELQLTSWKQKQVIEAPLPKNFHLALDGLITTKSFS